jgi:hypothetical protein
MYSLVCIPSGPKADWAQKLSCMLEAVNKFLIHQADVQHPKLTQSMHWEPEDWSIGNF